MRVILDREAAFSAVSAVQAVADKKNTIPIIQDVLIVADVDGITVSATNLDIWSSATAPAEAPEAGAVALPADRLHDLLRNLPSGGQVVLQTDAAGATAQLVCGRSRFKLLALPPGDFPEASQPPADAARVTLRADVLLRLIERVSFAASTDESRFMLTGVHLSVEDRDGAPVIRSAGASTRMIAWAEAPAGEGVRGMPPVSLSRRLVTELRRVLDGSTAEVTLELTHQRFGLAFAGRSLVAKLLDGEAPTYWHYFSGGAGTSVEVSTAELKMALKRCLMMADDKDRAVRAHLEDGLLRLSVRSHAAGEAEEEIEAGFHEEPLSFCINGAQLLEIAGQITGVRTVLRISPETTVLLVDDPADPACGYLTATLKG